MSMLNKTLAAALIAGGASSFAGSADAVPLAASLSLRDASTSEVQTVQWRRGWRWGGLGVGLAAGAIAGWAVEVSARMIGEIVQRAVANPWHEPAGPAGIDHDPDRVEGWWRRGLVDFQVRRSRV